MRADFFLKEHFLFFSAGVGRTGTYITLDTMLERMQHVDSVNVYECVKNLRSRRVFMVQTQVRSSAQILDILCLILKIHGHTTTLLLYMHEPCLPASQGAYKAYKDVYFCLLV